MHGMFSAQGTCVEKCSLGRRCRYAGSAGSLQQSRTATRYAYSTSNDTAFDKAPNPISKTFFTTSFLDCNEPLCRRAARRGFNYRIDAFRVKNVIRISARLNFMPGDRFAMVCLRKCVVKLRQKITLQLGRLMRRSLRYLPANHAFYIVCF